MTEQIVNQLNPTQLACALARGTETPQAGDVAHKIRAAHKDYSACGSRRAHWFRLVWRDGEWRYLGDRRLRNGNFLAADRHDTVYDTVCAGEIVVQHDRGARVDMAYLVVDTDDVLVSLEFTRIRSGLRLTLPDGATLDFPDPRK